FFSYNNRVFPLHSVYFSVTFKKSKQNKVKQTTFIAVYLVGSSMLTLDSWLRHLAKPLTYFSVTIMGVLHCTVSISHGPRCNRTCCTPYSYAPGQSPLQSCETL